MAKGKYNQMKAWPTRRIHLFFMHDELSLCGLVTTGQSFMDVQEIDWMRLKDYHEYDNLNYCQSCLRVAMATHKERYLPLKRYYDQKYGSSFGLS